jgi:hypothetical protein
MIEREQVLREGLGKIEQARDADKSSPGFVEVKPLRSTLERNLAQIHPVRVVSPEEYVGGPWEREGNWFFPAFADRFFYQTKLEIEGSKVMRVTEGDSLVVDDWPTDLVEVRLVPGARDYIDLSFDRQKPREMRVSGKKITLAGKPAVATYECRDVGGGPNQQGKIEVTVVERGVIPELYPPKGFQALVNPEEPGRVYLRWERDFRTTADKVGYLVERAVKPSEGEPKGEDWVLLTPEPIENTEYVDDDVEMKVTYLYRIYAAAPNGTEVRQ